MKTLIFLSLLYFSHAKKVTLVDDLPFENEENFTMVDRLLGLPSWLVIFPGTKWCGDGNIADNYEDLGVQADTDMCCRDHDHCPDIITSGETKFNLTNDSPVSRLSCDCDVALYHCFKAVDTFTSSAVGGLYFTIVNQKCFKEEHPIERCLKYTYIPWKKCVEYEVDMTKPKLYQWFDLPNY